MVAVSARDWLERHIRACGGDPADWDMAAASRRLAVSARRASVPFDRLSADTLCMVLSDALVRDTPANRRACRTILLPDEAWEYARRLERGDI